MKKRLQAVLFLGLATLALLAFPYYYPRLIPSPFRGLPLDASLGDVSFDLIDMNERRVRLADLRGKYLYLFFGFSRCDGICPGALAQFQRFAGAVREGEAQDAAFRILFLSIDPERDSAAQLRAYLAGFDQRFLALRDGKESVARVARRFGYRYAPPGIRAREGQINHADLVYVLDPAGRPTLLYTGVRAEDLIADWNLLQKGKNP